MNVFNEFLDEREAQRPEPADAELVAWLNQGAAPEVRLLKFDAWVGRQLATRLDWTWAGPKKARRIEQCRIYMERLVLDLWRRGWMLDGKRLARHLETVLDNIGAYQRAGKVQEFWPYFRACVDRYVGANAEEIHAESMQVGAHVSQLMNALGIRRPAAGPTLPELMAKRTGEVAQAKEETLRQKLARKRAQQAACNAAAQQPQLL